MSRIPSGPPYPHQLPPAGYYGNPSLPGQPLPPLVHQHQGLPPPPGSAGGAPYPAEAGMYPFEQRHPQSLPVPGGQWANPPGPGPPGPPLEAYASAGPSSRNTSGSGDPYAAYAQPARSSPSQPPLPRQAQQIPGGAAGVAPWSSVHPGRGGGVKLEDLVDRRSNPQPQAIPMTTQNTNVVVANESKTRPSTAGGNEAAGGTGGGKEGGGGQQGPSEFIKKLYKMLEEETATFGKGKAAGQPRDKGGKRGSVGWGRGGTSFVVWDMNDFTTKVLPQTFRHSNFSSFVRQLNKYGFSKIKHVDEESGTIKENVWEFQHPSFVAGGKSDLENIKRKAVAPRKTAGGENEDTSPRAFGLSSEDASRINVMENRIVNLEGKLERALEDVREARARETGMMNVLKEVISHLAANERETSGSPMSDGNYSPRILHLFKAYDSIPQPGSRSTPATSYGPPVSAAPYPSQLNGQYNMAPAPSFNPLYTNGTNQTSPRTDGTASRGSRGSMSGPATSGMRNVSGAPSRLGSMSGPSVPQSAPPSTQQTQIASAPVAVPLATAADSVPKEENIEATLYAGEPLSMTPMFAETPAWLTEGNQATMPMYHRKSSDGSTLRMMYDVLSGGGIQNTNGRFTEEGTALPTIENPITGSAQVNSLEPISEQQATSADNNAIESQQVPSTAAPSAISPPGGSSSKPFKKSSPHSSGSGSVVKPHWATTPKILVVEDDLVYRQLSSKFLSKFGCLTETVENAQGAIEKMNKDKYDLVLMDIFFGPNMDGRKATSLIRQFDNYTPIISMTSNAQPQDVDSYIRSGMNDILAKPFTKHGLFLILDKHLMHLRQAQIYEKIIPISVGVPPLSDQHVQEALAISAATIQQGNAGLLMGLNGGDMGAGGSIQNVEDGRDGTEENDEIIMRNPLAGSGWSDETYQLVLQQFLATGMMPDVNSLSTGAIGTGVIFGDSSSYNNNTNNARKRPIEALNDDGTVSVVEVDGGWSNQNGAGLNPQQQQQLNGQQDFSALNGGMGMVNGITIGFLPSNSTFLAPQNNANVNVNVGVGESRESKRARGVVG
uniref:Response regulatory domain-containing protein n=1 Tax=Kwoniella dejecticola CBS 10117 TaxID=1296121 RepID=A0A1A6A150_9TREE|nr:uncharacterized protein I303_06065 [Kwoniella dejecticola CBS 10117]OBR83783.1 hypothetical protein I303_06065 [Kwoniella dejecticola CBS 10117]